MSAALLEKAGVALYGPTTWKHPLARDLGVSLRALRRWADGEYPVPDDYWPKICALLLAHSLACRDIAAELPRAPLRQAVHRIDGDTFDNAIGNSHLVNVINRRDLRK